MSKQFKNILLALDGRNRDTAALELTADMAKRSRARLTVIEVMHELPENMRRMITLAHIADLQESAVNAQYQELDRLVASVRDTFSYDNISAKILAGTPYVEIIREVLRNKYDLVMLPAVKMNRLKELIFGNTEMNLIHKCPCPVWVIKPGQESHRNRILAFVNPDPFDAGKMTLSARILEASMHLASLKKSELHVIHIWSSYPENILYCYAGVSMEELENLISEKQKMHKRWIYTFLNMRMPQFKKCSVYFYEGRTEALIPKIAREYRPGLVVSGIIPGNSGMDFFAGSSLGEALRETDCSVLTIKHGGFESPVKLPERRIA